MKMMKPQLQKAEYEEDNLLESEKKIFSFLGKNQ
jgi:hypothetical protein